MVPTDYRMVHLFEKLPVLRLFIPKKLARRVDRRCGQSARLEFFEKRPGVVLHRSLFDQAVEKRAERESMDELKKGDAMSNGTPRQQEIEKLEGADPAKVRQALMGGFASSRILEVHGQRMVKRTFNPGFRIELHKKDLNLALATARQIGVALPNTATCQELFNACAAHGGSAWDHSGMVRALEGMANFEIGQTPAA